MNLSKTELIRLYRDSVYGLASILPIVALLFARTEYPVSRSDIIIAYALLSFGIVASFQAFRGRPGKIEKPVFATLFAVYAIIAGGAFLFNLWELLTR